MGSRKQQRAIAALTHFFLALGVIGSLLLAGAARGAEPEIVARVNGEPVSRDELQRVRAEPLTSERLKQGVQELNGKALDRPALQIVIRRHLILQEAERRKIAVSEQDLDQAVTALRHRFQDIESFGAWMAARGLDDKSLFETVRDEMLALRVRAVLTEDLSVTDEQLQEFYRAHQADLKTGDEVRLRIIVVKDRTAAEAVLTALQKGEKFADLARQRSVGMRAASGGDTGWIDSHILPPPLRELVHTLKPGDAGGPLQKDTEFVVVGLVDRRPGRMQSLNEARPRIERHLLALKRQEAGEAWLKEREKDSKIEVYLAP